jgi:Short C-terminal domain
MRGRGIGRAGRPGLVGTMARTAVIAGTATVVSNSVSNHQQAKAQQKAEAQAYEDQQQWEAQQAAAQPAPQQYAPPAPAPQVDVVGQLTQLAALRDQGVLTEAEFQTQKARVLGG